MGRNAVVAAMIVLSVVTTGLWSHPTAFAGQSLTETTTAVGISGEQHGRAGSNVLGAANKARGVAQLANAARRNDEVWEDAGPFKPVSGGQASGSGAAPSSETAPILSSKALESAYKIDGDAGLKAWVGQTGSVRGRVVEILNPEGQTFIVVRDSNDDSAPAFLFRFNGKPDRDFNVGDEVQLTGVFALRHVDKEIGVTYVFDVAGPGGAAPGEPVGDMYLGWRYRGCVRNESGFTGVFENETTKETVYAKPGKQLAEDVVVASVGWGEAKLRIADRTMPIIP